VPQLIIGCFVIPGLITLILAGSFFYFRSHASSALTAPELILVRAAPADSAPLLARFGQGQTLTITGRTEDWRWLEVELWAGRRGWALRPLGILVWQIEARPVPPSPVAAPVPLSRPVAGGMIAISATTFTMGSPPGLGEADEQPAHSVSLSAFEIDQLEVTVRQYWECVAAGVCAAPNAYASQTNPRYLNDPVFDNHPVINIPWIEANRYCGWLGKRLPTEAEWEMAASWDPQRKAKFQWPWGNEVALDRANLGQSPSEPAPVGTFPKDRSPVGVLDMAGNVSEWVFDWYKVDYYYYSLADDTNPVGPTFRRGEGTGRVIRGGFYADSPMEARTTNRRHQAETYGYPTVGFRCARDIQ
jgi:formylglycine-generating enzyme required for sulfatase activity